jgi:sigma-B regulation protein RsbQ
MTPRIRNNVTTTGSGRPLYLFAHGFGCDQNMWRHVAPAFSQTGTVVLFDLVGAGGSETSAYSSAKYGTLNGYASDIIEICEEMGLTGVTFVGHSVSATIGVLAAARRPDLFSKLVLVCPSPRYTNIEDYVGGFADSDIDELLDLMDKNHLDWSALMSPTVAGAEHVEAQQEWQASVCRTDPTIAKEFARVTFKSDHRADFADVNTPTLLLECSDDALAPPEVGAYVQSVMGDCRRLVLDATGHCPHMTAPDQVIAAVAAFAAEDLRHRAA